MVQINSLIRRLEKDYPDFIFRKGQFFKWQSNQKIIYYPDDSTLEDAPYLQHEVAHAILGHSTYILDIELINLERDAWSYAQTVLASQYDTIITDQLIDEALDTYREWLHKRSLCPTCSSSSLQNINGTYTCHLCSCSWRANIAQFCALKRYKVSV